jgi:hypothetical protein
LVEGLRGWDEEANVKDKRHLSVVRQRAIVSMEDSDDGRVDAIENGEDPRSWSPTADDDYRARAPSRGVVESVSKRARIPYTPERFPTPPPVPREFISWHARLWRCLWS